MSKSRLLLQGLFSCLLSLWLACSAVAHTVVSQDFVCPIDGHQFSQTVDASGTQFGIRLDLKPFGATAAPWTIPQCPKCKYVLYEKSPDKTTLKKLKPYILSEKYRKASTDKPTYYCLALIETFLGKKDDEIGNAYLQASWQADANPKQCLEYLALAYERYKVALTELKPDDEAFVTPTLVCGEFERRSGKFDEAARRFREAKLAKAFADANLQRVIDRQLALIQDKDTALHALDKKDDQQAE